MTIILGRSAYLLIWALLIYNLLQPFKAPANLLCYIALATLVLTHGLQAWLLNTSLTKQEKAADRYKVLRLFLFGIFESLNWEQSKNKQPK